jgi:hypothetical protein
VSDRTTLTAAATPVRDEAATITWLEAEFPGWEVSVDVSAGWEKRDLRSLWIARRDGHHPQAELSAAKLHTRLSDYLDREERRRALAN